MDANCISNILDSHTPFTIVSCAQLEIAKSSHNTNQLGDMFPSVLPQASNQVNPHTPLLSKDEFVHPIYMLEDDVIRLIQSGHIFFTEERLHYEPKNTAQTEIFYVRQNNTAQTEIF